MARPAEPHARRLARLRGKFRARNVEGILVTGVHNVRYLTGFTGDDSALLVAGDAAWFITDSRYTEQAGKETRRLKIVERRGGLMDQAGRVAARSGLKRLGFESNHLTVAQWGDLGRAAHGVELVAVRSAVEELRQVKTAEEVRRVQEAVRIAEAAFATVRPLVRPGRTERDLAQTLETAMRDLGADGPSFPTIVAAGERGSLPHARPTDRRVRRGEAVLFDWGARWGGYTSDLTRVVFVDTIPPTFERVYGIVLEAQRRAIRKVGPGVTADRVDRAARDFIKAHRHGSHFGHGVGHGLGIEIHEMPTLNARSKTALKPGMVITVEPGIYLPGRGGVRIEDDVLVTRTGSLVLTTLPKSLRDMLIRT